MTENLTRLANRLIIIAHCVVHNIIDLCNLFCVTEKEHETDSFGKEQRRHSQTNFRS